MTTDTTPEAANYRTLRDAMTATIELIERADLISTNHDVVPSSMTEEIRVMTAGQTFFAGIVPDQGMGPSYGWSVVDGRDDPDNETRFTDDIEDVRAALLSWSARLTLYPADA